MKQNASPNKKPYTLLAPEEHLPQVISKCPRCGGEIELWSEAEETRCLFCDFKLFDRESTTH